MEQKFELSEPIIFDDLNHLDNEQLYILAEDLFRQIDEQLNVSEVDRTLISLYDNSIELNNVEKEHV